MNFHKMTERFCHFLKNHVWIGDKFLFSLPENFPSSISTCWRTYRALPLSSNFRFKVWFKWILLLICFKYSLVPYFIVYRCLSLHLCIVIWEKPIRPHLIDPQYVTKCSLNVRANLINNESGYLMDRIISQVFNNKVYYFRKEICF